MSVYKDNKSNTWKVYYRFTDWQGKVHQSTKRGFPTKREALAWEWEQLHKVEADLDMTFESFIDTYTTDMKNRLKENTWHTKEHIIRTKLLPYFAKRKMNSIKPKDIIAWQNEMIKRRDERGEAYSPVYLKTVHNQLSAIFNNEETLAWELERVETELWKAPPEPLMEQVSTFFLRAVRSGWERPRSLRRFSAWI